MIPRNVSHTYYYTCSRLDSRLLMSSCIFVSVLSLGFLFSLRNSSAVESFPDIEPAGRVAVLRASRIYTQNQQACEFSLEGTENLNVRFVGFGACDCPLIKKVKMQHVDLDAKLFTESLRECENIESIILDKVSLLNEDFERVYLPHLTEYTLNRVIGFHEQYKDYANYTTPPKLLSALFYDKIKEQNISEIQLAEQMVQSNVNVTIRVDGWTVISVQDNYDLTIALKYAADILNNGNIRNYLDTVKSLSLTECIVSKNSVPRNLNYLNFYNVGFNDSSVSEIVDSMHQLRYLFLETPGIKIDLKSLPKTIKELSFSAIDLIAGDGDTIDASGITLGSISNQIVFENFHKMFPKAQEVAIFSPGDQSQHLLLLNILKSGARWILMENFTRTYFFPNMSAPRIPHTELTLAQIDIEEFLDKLKLQPEDKHFVLENKNDIWRARALSVKERFAFRYKLLGWEKYITIEAYKML